MPMSLGNALTALTGCLLGIVGVQLPAHAQGPLVALHGIVRDSTGAGIPEVRVTLLPDSQRTWQTDSLGRFRIPAVPAGIHQLALRRIGFVPATFFVTVRDDGDNSYEIELHALTQRLAAVEVTAPAAAGLGRTGFYERIRQREEGALGGTFIGPDEVAARRATRVTQLLEAIPGVRVERRYGRTRMTRLVGRDGRCLMAVFVDGQEVNLDPRQGIDDLLNARDVQAVEVYNSASGTPAQFQSNRLPNACGAVVIWTRVD